MKPYKKDNTDTLYYAIKQDFKSAYNSNGHNINLALHQVSQLRGIEVETLKIILRGLLK